MKNKKLAFGFDVGEPIDDGSGAYRRHRLSCELNVAYLVVGSAAALVIGTVLWLTLANGATIENASLNPNQQFHQNYQTLTTETPETNAIVDAARTNRLDFVRNMTRDAWNDLLQRYSTNGWTNQSWNNSVSKAIHASGYDNWKGLLMMQSMSTLWLANLKEEFAHAKTWIKPLRTFPERHIRVSEAVIEYVGSMASCYALTGDESCLNAAKETVNVLKSTHASNGLPWFWLFEEENTKFYNPHRLGNLAPYLEYRYMADLTQDTELDKLLSQYRSTVKSWPKSNGLYTKELELSCVYTSRDKCEYIPYNMAKFSDKSRPFYSYLLKAYIQSNFTDHESHSMFNQAIEALDAAGQINKWNQSEKFKPDYHCYLGALFGLSAWAKNRSRDDADDDAALMKKHLNWAVHFTDTCHSIINWSVIESMRYLGMNFYYPDFNILLHFDHHRAESYFVLYRLTGEPKYREYAWHLVQKLNYIRTEVSKTTELDFTIFYDYYDKHFWGSTLKYLNLIFAEEHLLSLDEWVFNRNGQPLPICGQNRKYPGDKCGGKLWSSSMMGIIEKII